MTQVTKKVRLSEQIKGGTGPSYALHPTLGPEWWEYSKRKNDLLYFHAEPFTREAYQEEGLDTRDRGAWIIGRPTGSKTSGYLLSAAPKEKKIEILGHLSDPRVSAILISSARLIPEMLDFEVIRTFKETDGYGEESLGTLRNIVSRAKSLSIRSKEWKKDRQEPPSYQDFEYQVLEDLQDLPWYHATTWKALSSIRQKGLLPSGTSEQGSGWTQLNLDLQKAVYLTADKDYAQDIAETLALRTGEPGVVLRVDGSALSDHSRLVVDEDSIRNEYDGGVSGGMMNTDLPDFMTSVVDGIRSLGYEGKIPASKITPIEVIVVEEGEEDEFYGSESETLVYSFEEYRKTIKEHKQRNLNEQEEPDIEIPEPPDALEDESGLDLGGDSADLGDGEDLDLGDGEDFEGGDDFGGSSGGFGGGGGGFGGGGGDFGGDDFGGDDDDSEAEDAPEPEPEPKDPVEHAVSHAKEAAAAHQSIQQILTALKSIVTDRTISPEQMDSILQQLKEEDDVVLSAVANRLNLFARGTQ